MRIWFYPVYLGRKHVNWSEHIEMYSVVRLAQNFNNRKARQAGIFNENLISGLLFS